MTARRTNRHGLRRAAIATAAGLAFAGATLIGATSATASGTDTTSCIATSSASALASGLLDCIASGTTAIATAPAIPTVPTAPTAAPTPVESPAPVQAPTTATDAVTPAPTETVAPGPAPTSAPTAPGELRTVRVITTTNIVYPSATGYSKSTVRFSIRGLTADRTGVQITGSAVLRKGTTVVKTWPISNATTTLTWDGRNGAKVDPGRYVLTATAWSSDGSRAMSTMRVRVSAKHLVTRTVSVRTRDLAKVHADTLPVAVMKAFAIGPVTFRVHTIAKVTGTARLVITGPAGEKVAIPLQDGTHATKDAVLPKSFTSAAFHHEWKRGAAKLVELHTVFTYKQLV